MQPGLNNYGEDIIIRESQYYKDKVSGIKFEVNLVSKEDKPREVTRTIVDINMKEFKNYGKEAQDETIVKASKSSTRTSEDRFKFSTTKGVDFSFGGNIGAQVMGLAVAGGSLGVNAAYNKKSSKTEATEFSNVRGLHFSYAQEEKMIVPAGKYVKAMITTYSMKYEMNYTLRFSIGRNIFIPLWYRTRCQQFCCGLCNYSGTLFVRDMISGLPDYNGEDEEGKASFTQVGTLSWIGEGCSVDKVEELLGN